MKVSVVKHDPKDKAVFDVSGKDSQRFFASGADVLVVSPTRTTVFKHHESEFEEIVSSLGEFDLLIVEGLKNWQLPRISLFRESFDESYLAVSSAVALSEKMSQYKNVIPTSFCQYDLDDIDGICEWILENAKEI